MNMDLTTGDDFLDKLKTPFVPFENPYADLQDPFFWEEQTTNLIIFAVSMFVLTFGIPGWNYFFYIVSANPQEGGLAARVPPAPRNPPPRRPPSFRTPRCLRISAVVWGG